MSSPDPPPVSSLSRRSRLVTKSTLAALASLVAFGACLATWHYRTHLAWRFGSQHAQLRPISSVPVQAMPKTAVPADWMTHEAGCVDFRLPPELVLDPDVYLGDDGLAQFYRGDHFSVLVTWSDDSFAWDDLLSLAKTFSPESRTFTAPQLRLEFYRAGTDDFRWSMTPQQVQWHVFCMTVGKMTRLISAGHVETFCSQDLEAIIHFGDRSTMLEWHCKESPWGGYMHFQFHEQPDDRALVRAICESLQWRPTAERR